MNDKPTSKYHADPLDSAMIALKERIKTINKAVENVNLAEAKTPDDTNQVISNDQINRLVNVGQTTTDNQPSEQSLARQNLKRVYNSIGNAT